MDESILKMISCKRVALRKHTNKNDKVVIGKVKLFKSEKGYSIELKEDYGIFYISTKDLPNWELLRVIGE
jgi:hypothetical protein